MGISQSNRKRRHADETPVSLVGAVAVYDPSDHTVEAVLAHVAEHPDQAEIVLQQELVGLNRVTIIRALTPRE